MSRRSTSPVLVGREDHLFELLAALDQARLGNGGLVVVEGEAGIGKSRLIEEFVARARDAGAQVLGGSCLPFADAVPYAPVAAILGELSSRAEDVGPNALVIDATDRFRFFGWVAGQLRTAAADRVLVVVVEDLHWADESTGDLLLFAANAVRTAPVLFVVSRRPGEGDRSNGLAVALGELMRSGRAHHVRLAPLDPDEVRELVGQIIGSDPPRALLERVTSRADGNPFFAEELVAAGGGEDLPATVGDVILQRVARVDRSTRHLLHVAAVIGRRVSHSLLRDVAAIDPTAIDAALRNAVDNQLLVAIGEHYSFRHALGHEAVYGDLLPGERAAIHERVATVLAAHPEMAIGEEGALAAAELAHHWHAAGRLAQSLTASVHAGQAAEAAHAPIEAQVHFRRALELWLRVADAETVAGTDRLWLLEHAADVASLAGSHHGAVQLADQLIAELDAEREPERHARLLDRRALYSWRAGDLTTSRRATEALREGIESGMTLASVTRLCGLAYQSALELRYLDALALARDALIAAHQVGGGTEVGYALHVLGSLEGHLGDHDQGIERLHESLQLATPDRDPQRIGSTWHNLIETYVFAGRGAEAADLAQRGLVELERLGLRRTYAALTRGQLTLALAAVGRWDEADRVSAAVLADDVDPYFAVPVRFGRLHLLVRRGRFDEAEAMLADLDATFGAYDYMAGVCAAWEAELALWQGDRPRARAALARAVQIVSATDEVMLELRLTTLVARLEADELGGAHRNAASDRTAARDAVDARLARAEQFVERIEAAVDCCSLPFHRTLRLARAERSRLDDSPSPALWAAVASDAAGDPYVAAYARWRGAEAVLGGDPRHGRAAAEALLADAGGVANNLGAEPLASEIVGLARRARILLTTIGSGDPRDDSSPDELAQRGLTVRELEVLRLVGDGLSNREIGEALFISAKTASVHVTHIFQKLHVTSRAQAAVAAHLLAQPPAEGASTK